MSEPELTIRRLLYGQLLSRAVQTFAELEVADRLGDADRPVAELAAECRVPVDPLRRLLRALAAFDLVAESAPEVFRLRPLGAAVRAGAPASALPTAQLAAGEVGTAWDHLLDTVRTGTPAFERLFGTGFFGYLERKPGLRAVFDRSQAAGLELELPEVLRRLDLAGAGTAVDVGGGDGALLAALLAAAPGWRGVLVDRPEAVAAAERRFADAGLADRCAARPGDFFAELPGGGDLYLLRHILHDWADEPGRAVLASCRRALATGPAGARLVVVEQAAAARGDTGEEARFAALLDLYMLSLFGGGRERTVDELVDLLGTAGLSVVSVAPLPGGAVLIEAVLGVDGGGRR
ncbi:methyltransferase [Amycolatopsis arida]|uniref:methyltransferase n=1 Tax=Amycolatopsis arida TaxID=587909 RepID=UPI001416FB9B|nr:methyltransferase [Amycolatopsis arida]